MRKPRPSRKFVDHFECSILDKLTTLRCAAVAAYNALYGPVALKAGDVVLVQGTGGVSMYVQSPLSSGVVSLVLTTTVVLCSIALQLAVASGATVIATSSSSAKLAKAKELGATHLINYIEKPDWDQEVLKLTNGRGVDHVIEVGGPGTIIKSVNATRIGGQIHIIGFVAGVRASSSDSHCRVQVRAWC